jgi:histone deacetylase complex regulatory component SIN3
MGDDNKRSFSGFGKGTKNEHLYFEKLNQMLPDQYDDIMKVFKLYNDCVIGADEMLEMIKPAFLDEPEMYEYFKVVVFSREVNRRVNKQFCKQLSDLQHHGG